MKTRGFTLFETLLALMIFSMAVVALVEAVHQLGNTTLHQRRESEVQERVRSLLLEYSRLPNMPEDAEVKEGDVVYKIKRTQLDLRNRDDVALTNLFEIRVTADWQEGSLPQQISAETWVYPPLFLRP